MQIRASGGAYAVNQDLNAIEREKGLLQIAFREVRKAVIDGRISPQYLNQNDLGTIVNFVFQGENNTGNSDITQIGTNILKNIGKYDTQTKTVKPLIQE